MNRFDLAAPMARLLSPAPGPAEAPATEAEQKIAERFDPVAQRQADLVTA